jgi:hypothetical protein
MQSIFIVAVAELRVFSEFLQIVAYGTPIAKTFPRTEQQFRNLTEDFYEDVGTTFFRQSGGRLLCRKAID